MPVVEHIGLLILGWMKRFDIDLSLSFNDGLPPPRVERKGIALSLSLSHRSQHAPTPFDAFFGHSSAVGQAGKACLMFLPMKFLHHTYIPCGVRDVMKVEELASQNGI